VVSLTAQQGQTLNATQTTPVILRIADLATMTVWTQVSEADVLRLKLGMGAYFTTLGDQEHRWQGKLLQILPTPDVVNNVVLYPALFDVQNPDGNLMTQMSAQVFFVVDSVKNAVTVPVAALRPVKGSIDAPKKPDSPDAKPYTVRVLGIDGKESRRPIWIGVMNRVSAEVLSGLQPGDTVIVGRHATDGSDGAASTQDTNKGKNSTRNPMRRLL
jgi:macrolide-specific efflux system membrane fusion protein